MCHKILFKQKLRLILSRKIYIMFSLFIIICLHSPATLVRAQIFNNTLPSILPTTEPTSLPSAVVTTSPSITRYPSFFPSTTPTILPTLSIDPTSVLSFRPSGGPSHNPTHSTHPSTGPTHTRSKGSFKSTKSWSYKSSKRPKSLRSGVQTSGGSKGLKSIQSWSYKSSKAPKSFRCTKGSNSDVRSNCASVKVKSSKSPKNSKLSKGIKGSKGQTSDANDSVHGSISSSQNFNSKLIHSSASAKKSYHTLIFGHTIALFVLQFA